MPRKNTITLNINTLSYSDAIKAILLLGIRHLPSYICFANIHMIIEAHKDKKFKHVVDSSNFTFPDGMPLVYFFKKKYGISQDRIAGIDFMMDAVCECEKENLSVFLFGSTETVLNALSDVLKRKFPNLVIAGCISPPFSESHQYENDNYIKQINASGANLVFVSLGCPKQELWMSANHSKINAVLLGVGAAFEINAGIKKRAPLWMQRSGLEWFYRLFQEPGRLWKRYLETNTIFIYLFIVSLFSKKT